MRRHIAAWLAFGLAAGLPLSAGMPPAPEPQPKTMVLSVELPNNPTVGARLFVQKGCVRCHALGTEEGRVGPDLGRLHFRGTVLDLAGAFWNHSPVMHEKMADLKIRPPTLTSGEMADLVGFLTAYRYYLTEIGQPADPAAGAAIFKAKGCAQCHAAAEDFKRPGPSLEHFRGRASSVLLAQAMWNHGPEMASVMLGRGVPWPKFTGREMGDLLAYLRAGTTASARSPAYFEPGSPRRGRDLFTGKRCITCHAIAGTGGHGGPDLSSGGRALVESVPAIAGLMWNHSQGMTAEFARRGISRVSFSGQEMADIIAYLYFVNYANVRGTPARGGQLFVSKCSACHAIGAKRIGPDLASVPQLDDPIAIMAAMWNHSALMDQELHKRGLAWPLLEPGDAADLTAFLLTSRARPAAPPAAR